MYKSYIDNKRGIKMNNNDEIIEELKGRKARFQLKLSIFRDWPNTQTIQKALQKEIDYIDARIEKILNKK